MLRTDKERGGQRQVTGGGRVVSASRRVDGDGGGRDKVCEEVHF